jgi:hypothetical protein
VTLWQVNLPCESLQKNFLTCDNYDSVIYGRALRVSSASSGAAVTGFRCAARSCATAALGANAPARAAAPAAPTCLNTLRRDTSRSALSSVSLAMDLLIIQFFVVVLHRVNRARA